LKTLFGVSRWGHLSLLTQHVPILAVLAASVQAASVLAASVEASVEANPSVEASVLAASVLAASVQVFSSVLAADVLLPASVLPPLEGLLLLPALVEPLAMALPWPCQEVVAALHALPSLFA